MIYVVFKEVIMMVFVDVFVGICVKFIGFIFIYSLRFFGKRYIRYNRCCYKFIFIFLEIIDVEMFLVWKEINNGKECILFEIYYGFIFCKFLIYFDSFKRFYMGIIKNNVMYFGD